MNSDVFKGKWMQIKGEVKSQWGKLTDDDLDRVEGDAEKLVGRVQERYGYAREDAKREVDSLIDFGGGRALPGLFSSPTGPQRPKSFVFPHLSAPEKPFQPPAQPSINR